MGLFISVGRLAACATLGLDQRPLQPRLLTPVMAGRPLPTPTSRVARRSPRCLWLWAMW